MGDCVGQLLYGIPISKEQFNGLLAEKSRYKMEESLQGRFPEIGIDRPYETDDRFVCIKASNKSSYNEGMPLAKTIETPPDWDTKLQAFCEATGIPFNASAAQWYLIGRYN